MLESIIIRDYACFDKEGVSIQGLNKVNIVFGRNGSGKTSITRLIQDSSLPEFQSSSLLWKGGRRLETIVYNQDFIKHNFSKGSIDGVYSIGRESVENQKNLEIFQTQKSSLEKNIEEQELLLINLSQKEEELEEEFREKAWRESYKKYEIEFKPVLSRYRTKRKFLETLLKAYSSKAGRFLSYEDIVLKIEILHSRESHSLSLIDNYDFSSLHELENDEIWAMRITGRDDAYLSKRIEELGSANWFSQGLGFLQEDSDICPFCHKESITKSFREEIDNYFDESYKEHARRLIDRAESYITLSYYIMDIILDSSIRASKVNGFDAQRFSNLQKTIENKFLSNFAKIEKKRKSLGTEISLEKTKEELTEIGHIITEINKDIEVYNQILLDREKEGEELESSLWRFLAEDMEYEIKGYLRSKQDVENRRKETNSSLKRLRTTYDSVIKEIAEINKATTNTISTIDNINASLSGNGFDNFFLAPSSQYPNQYLIQRDSGFLAGNTLSEGEKNMVSLLYFLSLARGSKNTEDLSKDRILVIDDPSSGLDMISMDTLVSEIQKLMLEINKPETSIKQIIFLINNPSFLEKLNKALDSSVNSSMVSSWVLKKEKGVSRIL